MPDSQHRTPPLALQPLLVRLASEYREWWISQSPFGRYGLLILICLYWAILHWIGGFRGDHLTTGFLFLLFYYLGPKTQALFKTALPFLLIIVIYDSQRFWGDYVRGTIHVTEPHAFDLYFFGINTPEGRLTPNEFWQKHTMPWLDLITGFAYLVFILEYVAKTLLIRFWLKLPRVSLQMAWSFFFVNVIGYTTYYWYPAAPPWYVEKYGLGPPNMEAMPNPAGCIRFDQLLGTHFFTGMYGRSADVFGAVPSLHVAYPFIAIWFAYRVKAMRAWSIFFFLLMAFSAVYLNHHYLLDILWGMAYGVLVIIGVEKFWPKDTATLARV